MDHGLGRFLENVWTADANEKYYCSRCGQEMIMKPTGTYDRRTGKPRSAWVCPNARWWNCHDSEMPSWFLR